MSLDGQLLKNIWEKCYEVYAKDDFYPTVIGTVMVMIMTYWLLGILFLLVDVTDKTGTLVRYRIQNNLPYQITRAKLVQTAKIVLFNQTVVAIPVFTLAHIVRKKRGYVIDSGLPTFSVILRDFAFFVMIEEAAFYYSHRLLHNPLFYKHFHKLHHEWTSPIGISALYCHPVEHVLSNILPPLMGPVFMNSHIAILWLWEAITTAYGVILHSGYHVPTLPSPEFHNYHHAKFTENFGVFGILDRFHGTSKSFHEYTSCKKNL